MSRKNPENPRAHTSLAADSAALEMRVGPRPVPRVRTPEAAWLPAQPAGVPASVLRLLLLAGPHAPGS
jgi:hypothetical protein